MHNNHSVNSLSPWNKGKLIGQKFPLKLHEIWSIRIRLEIAINGVRLEWHLLKLLRVTKFSYIFPRLGPWDGEQRVGFWSPFYGSRLDSPRAIPNTLLGH